MRILEIGDEFGRRHPGFGGPHWIAILLMATVAAAVVVLAVGLWRRRGVAPLSAPPLAPPSATPTANAEALLADRLARSEISVDDYRATLAALRGQ